MSKVKDNDQVQLGETKNEVQEVVKLQDNGQLKLESESNESKRMEWCGDPFGKLIGAKELFEHQQIREVQEMIKTALEQNSMTFISGPPGVGKTSAVRSVTEKLPVNKFLVIYLGQNQHGSSLMQQLAATLGMQPKRYRSQLSLQLGQWLTNNLNDGGKQVVLVIDEGQLVDDQTLEELRLLSNADYDRQSPFTLILIGQPWLRARLKAPFFEPLSQRLRYRYSLEGLSMEETLQYVRGRLSAAGGPPDLFTDDALRQLFVLSEGIPRRINNICAQILLKVKASNLSQIDAALIKQVVDSQDV